MGENFFFYCKSGKKKKGTFLPTLLDEVIKKIVKNKKNK
jgi:hypothetical protein